MTTISATRTGYVFEELYMWHDPGSISFQRWVEPGETWENIETKRRINSLLNISGMLDKVIPIRARSASKEEITRFHTESYHDRIVLESKNSKGGDGGELARFAQGGYEIAALSVGGVLAAIEAVVDGRIDNAYCLVRPPGHHAVADMGMGFCIFNNIALGALHVRTLKDHSMKRIAIVDYDVHHGNGTQAAFWNDSEALFISLHQDNNYPQGEGSIHEIGGESAKYSNVNIPLPPGSGMGAYAYAFQTVVIPSLRKFKPDFILVSSGFDASFADPLGSMMLSSEAFGTMAKELIKTSEELCCGRIVFCHEGGYSKDYVPFCGLAVMEALTGFKTEVVDHYLVEVNAWGYQSMQPHQKAVIDACASLHGLLLPMSSFSESEGEVMSAIESLLAGVNDADRRRDILEGLLLKHQT